MKPLDLLNLSKPMYQLLLDHHPGWTKARVLRSAYTRRSTLGETRLKEPKEKNIEVRQLQTAQGLERRGLAVVRKKRSGNWCMKLTDRGIERADQENCQEPGCYRPRLEFHWTSGYKAKSKVLDHCVLHFIERYPCAWDHGSRVSGWSDEMTRLGEIARLQLEIRDWKKARHFLDLAKDDRVSSPLHTKIQNAEAELAGLECTHDPEYLEETPRGIFCYRCRAIVKRES